MGRPKGAKNKRSTNAPDNITEYARQYGPRAIEVLAQIMNQIGHPDQVKAATVLLERGYGKPRQEVAHSGKLEIPRAVFEVIPKSDNDKI